MKVVVAGLWHLGTVTAASLAANGHDVTGFDVDAHAVAELSAGRPPLFEPGLEELVAAGIGEGHLRFTTDVASAVGDADVVWITYDTPVDEDDRPDTEFVVEQVARLFPYLPDGVFVLISSQLPAGTTAKIERIFAGQAQARAVGFGYLPENVRLGQALSTFMHPDGTVVGVRSEADREVVTELLRPFSSRIEWMGVESAEMVKHGRNAFLATSVAFINEIARVSEQIGADASEVARGLKMDSRIGPKAYLSPGGAFAGGTLARDLVSLAQLGQILGVATPLISSVKSSNDAHRLWDRLRLEHMLGTLTGTTIAVWGLAYKPGTDTLRRSSAVELCRWLHAQGAVVHAHDPAVKSLPPDWAHEVHLSESALEAADAASALVVATPWPEYRRVAAADLAERMRRPLVLDANRFLRETMGGDPRIEYLSVGKAR